MEGKINKSGGRPPKDIKREKLIRVYLTDSEYDYLNRSAEAREMSASAYVRTVCLDKPLPKFYQRLTEQELQIMKALVGIANNLNQITKKLHAEGFASSASQMTRLTDEIKSQIDKLR
jgi:hypothetical protein